MREIDSLRSLADDCRIVFGAKQCDGVAAFNLCPRAAGACSTHQTCERSHNRSTGNDASSSLRVRHPESLSEPGNSSNQVISGLIRAKVSKNRKWLCKQGVRFAQSGRGNSSSAKHRPDCRPYAESEFLIFRNDRPYRVRAIKSTI
jgi:hypothetical protein